MAKNKPTGVAEASPVEDVSRHIKPTADRLLYVRAGGRCEFAGCNQYLLEHPLTKAVGNFGEKAHVVAFRVRGPRGQLKRPDDINGVENLMLLCPACHKAIDEVPAKYSREVLETYKQEHEKRILLVTGFGPDQRTTVVQLKAKIDGQPVGIPAPHVYEAVAPRYPKDTQGHIIDLTQFADETAETSEVARKTLRSKIAQLFDPGMDVMETRHLSVFALAPIPLLVELGAALGNKVAVDLFQRHRDTQDWKWKEQGDVVRYRMHEVRSGTDSRRVALVLSLSGIVSATHLPPEIDGSVSIYEITLDGTAPSPTFLRLRADLEAFRVTYREWLAGLAKKHPNAETIDLFPAVPAPIAIACGQELLTKAYPPLRVYDFNRNRDGFALKLTVGQSEAHRTQS